MKENNENKLILFTDIDDTLIQTARKTDFSREVLPFGYKETGEVSSYIYKDYEYFINNLLKSNFKVIPTTARNYSSYYRTNFYKKYKFSTVILNFSAEIYENNQKNQEWGSIIRTSYQQLITTPDEVLLNYKQLINQKFQKEFIPKIKNIDNFYVSIYNKNFPTEKKLTGEIYEFTKMFIEDQKLEKDFYLYQNDASIGILPTFLNKKNAVEFLIKKYEPIFTIGAGDNYSDFDFMNLTDFSLIPKKSSLKYLSKK